MAFVAVGNGEVIYLKGYGLADVESGKPVSPDETLFRVGSISTVVTATALLQLVERGRLALDEDVNLYLRRWKLPSTFDSPVTLRSLLTHTAGFDGKKLEIRAPTSADERNYGAGLQKVMPARYAPPGRYYSFSGMSYALLGAIIERYSRQNFPAAIARHVFQPLGMKNSAFTLTDGQMSRLATGYDGNGHPVDYSYFRDMPASSMSATASDMGRFMLAQLGEGALGGSRILPQMYANSMLRRHFSPHPTIEGAGLAYREKFIRGLRTLQQSGDIPGYSSFLMLIPEKNFGLFFAANVSGLDFSDDLAKAIIDRFFPPQAPGPGVLQNSANPQAMTKAPVSPNEPIRGDIAGFYRHNGISRHTAEKIMSLTADQLAVFTYGNYIAVSHTRENAPTTLWRPAVYPSESSGDLFRRVDEDGDELDEYAFFERRDGRVTALVIGDVSHTYNKLPPYESYYNQITFALFFAAAVVVSALGTIVGVAVNKRKLPWEKGLRSATELWSISLLFCGIQISFIVCMFVSVYYFGEQFPIFVPYQVKALFIIPLAGCLLLAWFWFRLLANIINPDHHWAEKILLVSVAAVETGYILFLANWRLLGFMF